MSKDSDDDKKDPLEGMILIPPPPRLNDAPPKRTRRRRWNPRKLEFKNVRRTRVNNRHEDKIMPGSKRYAHLRQMGFKHEDICYLFDTFRAMRKGRPPYVPHNWYDDPEED